MEPYKETYAQAPGLLRDWNCAGEVPTLLETITNSRATVLLGRSGRARAFNEPGIRAMSRLNDRPVIFALSNPTSACEALPEDLMTYSEGRAIIATGSPFADVMWQGGCYPVPQGNNAFIFPGLGLACVLGQVRVVTDSMVLEAALALAEYTASRNFDPPRVYPPVEELQLASIAVAVRVLETALREGVVQAEIPEERIAAFVTENFWHPRYLPVRRG
jgi:malate dehydrogenase (oxaloacetate-decarboxylating)